MLLAGEIDQLNGMQHDGTLFKRATTRKAPHNSYITFKNIEKGSADANFDMSSLPETLAFLTDKEIEELQGDNGEYAKISYDGSQFTVEYEYDETSGNYTRSSGGEQTVELDTNEAVHADNVIIIETSHQLLDSEGRRAIDLTSGGKAFVLQKGIVKDVEWKNQNGKMLPYENGLPMKLVPGKTWINIVPKNVDRYNREIGLVRWNSYWRNKQCKSINCAEEKSINYLKQSYL